MPIFQEVRQLFHKQLLEKLATIDATGIPSCADSGNKTSIRIAHAYLSQLGSLTTAVKLKGQEQGNIFELLVREFLRVTFLKIKHLRPGEWKVRHISGRTADISQFEQYEHLWTLAEFVKVNPEIASSLGNDYYICPDVIIEREPEPDETINALEPLVSESVARLAPLRKVNNTKSLLHASISCKYTFRSDRAQNARTEALNLIRNRKGRLPHIAVVTAEPLPSRLASLALGTGDIDCLYHVALPELEAAVAAEGNGDTVEALKTMIVGKRLRDIADLPLDLAV